MRVAVTGDDIADRRVSEHASPPEIAMIGGSGRVGAPAARLLAAAGLRFRALTRDVARTSRLLGSHCEAWRADLRDVASIEEGLRGVERLFLSSSEPALEAAAIAAAARAGVRRIVEVGALGASRATDEEHRDAERALLASGVEWTLLLPTAYHQTLATMAEATIRAASGSAPTLEVRLPAGDARVAWVDARDVAAVAVHALLEPGHAGRTYVVTGPASTTMRESVEVLAHALGAPLRYVPIPPDRAGADRGTRTLSASELATIEVTCARIRTGALDVVTDAVARVARLEPRTLAHFAATHAWPAALDSGVTRHY